MFRPCIVIPIYNHGSTIESVLNRIAPFHLPVFIVDDGSNSETQTALNRLPNPDDGIWIHRRQRNGGKGAALRDGFELAHKKGFSHVLQVDADGQHQIEDIPRFLSAAEAQPEALVLGKPILGPDSPWIRRWGRELSVFWVRVETLSKRIADPLFGFRMYPLASTVSLMRKTKIGLRMDFDPEIAVRLCWTGIPIQNLDSVVTYPREGISHFRMLRDNIRISWMHFRLVLGMIIRFPNIIKNRKHS